MEIRKVHVSLLNPAAYNPRKALQPGEPQYESLKRSMTEFGYVDPIIWNEQTGNVVGGHQRLDILLLEGYEELDVSIVNLDLEKEKALNVALNKISGAWDMAKLSDLFQTLEIDPTLTGFDTLEIEDITTDNTIDIDSLFAPAPLKEPKPKEKQQLQCPNCLHQFEVAL